MLGELLKNSQETVVPFLTSYFNHLFNISLFPEQWSKALLVPIHKKGSINDPDNYRGISLLSNLSKCYTYILNKRLEVWAESQGKLVEEQGGFRKGRSTVDHIFVMISMVEKALAKSKGKLYVAFVDFRKAYDSVNRNILWDILRRAGAGGKMLRALRAMYNSVVASVRVEVDCTTEEFSCPVGLKQEKCSSPLLFSFFINELATTVRDKGTHGVQFVQGMAEVFLLLFADDVALVSLTPGGLQKQLNNLKAEADRLKLEVNLAKTSIIVFRKGGHLSRHERWTYGDVELEVVNSYKYLGIALTTKLSTTQAVADLIPKAKRKIITILKALRKINCTDWGVFSKIFDAQIQPALLYASGIWGTRRVETVEKVHLFAIKRFLGLSNRTPSIIVYGESGRYPLAVSSQIRSIKYWLRLLKLNQYRLPFGAYRCSQNLAERGKVSWAGRVKELLLKQGFGEVWYNQGVGDEKKFLMTFSQRLKDCFGQSWHDKLESIDRFFEYKLMKQNFGMEEYICSVKGHLRDALLRFRAGVSWIKAHRFRLSLELIPHARFAHTRQRTNCMFCANVQRTIILDPTF